MWHCTISLIAGQAEKHTQTPQYKTPAHDVGGFENMVWRLN